MTAFSTGVICQPLLALQLTKEAEVGERGRRRSGVGLRVLGQRGELGLFQGHKWGCIIICF